MDLIVCLNEYTLVGYGKLQKELMKVAAKFIKEATFDSDEETFIKEQIDESTRQLHNNQDIL